MALVAEALLVLVVLTLGSSLTSPEGKNTDVALVSFKAAPHQEQEEQEEEQQETKEEEPQEQEQEEEPVEEEAQEEEPTIQPVEQPPVEEPEPQEEEEVPSPRVEQETAPPPMIRLPSRAVAAMDIAKLPSQSGPPAAANQSKMGPADTGARTGDTPRVSGSGPNGEPLYAASWYREPYAEELRGYLSTATGPGWGLIACRTAPDYRVKDCVKVDEYPAGSNIARAALGAAWQFRVRPPRIGGQPKIGEWVRIRIDYATRPQARP